jgi:hypothetical protein
MELQLRTIAHGWDEEPAANRIVIHELGPAVLQERRAAAFRAFGVGRKVERQLRRPEAARQPERPGLRRGP